MKEGDEEKWEFYARDEDEANFLYNTTNVQHLKGNIVRVWVKAFYAEKHPKYTMAKFQWEVDCTKKALRGITASAVKKDNTVESISEPSDWSPIPAESTAETLYEKICSTGPQKMSPQKAP